MTRLSKKILMHVAMISYLFNATMAIGQEPTRNEWLKIATTGIFSTVTMLGLTQIETNKCTWCGTNAFDLSISRMLIVDNLPTLYHTSDAMAFGLAPILAMSGVALVSTTLPVFARDALIVFSTVAFTSMITETAKVAARRARPEVVFGLASPDVQSNRSFWSGHTSLTFSLLSSASTLVLMRRPVWGPYFVAMSALVAGFVGYTRIAAARHWASDVLMGMVVGTAAGVAMPFFLLDNSSVHVAFSGDSLALGYSW